MSKQKSRSIHTADVMNIPRSAADRVISGGVVISLNTANKITMNVLDYDGKGSNNMFASHNEFWHCYCTTLPDGQVQIAPNQR